MVKMSPAEQLREHEERERLRLLRWRTPKVVEATPGPAEFLERVLRDEESGKRIKLAPMHREWMELISTHSRLVLWSHTEGGKTSAISIGRSLYELGLNPALRIAIVSKSSNQAIKIARACGGYISRSETLKQIFPALKPSQNISDPWTTSALTVVRPNISKDPSLQACGVIRGAVHGSRIDWLILDDCLDYENTQSQQRRDELWGWLKSTLFGRLTSDAHVIAVGNVWGPDDAMHRLANEPHYVAKRFPVLDTEGNSSWPERFTPERIERSRLDYGPIEFARQMLCVERDDSTARFKREWIDVALQRGRGYELVPDMDEGIPDGFAVFTGVDLGVSEKDGADFTVLFTVLLWPDGTRQVISIESGRWSGPTIVDRIESLWQRFGGLVVVENNAAQQYIIQFAQRDTAAAVKSFTTGKNKANPEFGVESIAAEMARGAWVIPCGEDGSMCPEVTLWVNEMAGYSPDQHTGDRLMASWFAREACRAFERRKLRQRGRVPALEAAAEALPALTP